MTVDESRTASTIDEADIARLLDEYAWCVDDKRWEDWEACFTADAEIRMPFAAHDGSDGLAEWGRAALAPFEKTHHMSSNFQITVEGDTAFGRSKFQAVHVPRADRSSEYFVVAGTYHWRFRRTEHGWRIRRCEIEVAWTYGDDATGLSG
ncbi:nuclear transport factor 2 family protein [Rhizohabitans arisaemae]|uniref:nuclear transport factor 2 family protein n=1 Tax=Rhizohabitans arisaemae TaxID=2720610 RepID=UPI0024B21515|nr:nuclear transport factor 2 family protein [Rhizohabitans arisaemae]